MNLNGQTYPQTQAKPAPPEGGVLGAVFAWLWALLCLNRPVTAFSVFEDEDRLYRAVSTYPWNRKQRRMATCHHKIPASRVPGGFDRVISRGLTSTQRLERLARLSLHGRVRVYKLQYRGNRARRCRALRHQIKFRPRSAGWLGLIHKHSQPRMGRGP